MKDPELRTEFPTRARPILRSVCIVVLSFSLSLLIPSPRTETRDRKNRPLGEAGAGQPFKVDIDGPKGPIDAKLVDNGDGTYRCDYQANGAGTVKVAVTLEGEHVARSPYKVRCGAGAFHGNTRIEQYTFVVRAKTQEDEEMETGGELEFFSVEIDGPGEPKKPSIVDLKNGTYVVSYSLPDAKEGSEWKISCLLNGNHIRGSPFHQRN